MKRRLFLFFDWTIWGLARQWHPSTFVRPAGCAIAALSVCAPALFAQSPPMAPSALQPQPTDAAELSVRQARGARFDIVFDAGATWPALENADPRAPGPVTNVQPMPADELPVAFSDTIIVGKITNIQAWQSNNHTAIYTETTVNVQQVVSQEANNTSGGSEISIDQPGGSILLPSGRVITNSITGLGAPLTSAERYVFS